VNRARQAGRVEEADVEGGEEVEVEARDVDVWDVDVGEIEVDLGDDEVDTDDGEADVELAVMALFEALDETSEGPDVAFETSVMTLESGPPGNSYGWITGLEKTLRGTLKRK